MPQGLLPVALIQARMSSQRLPGKMLKEVQGKTLLEHVFDRVSKSRLLEKVAIATSENSSDEPIFEYCLKKGIECYRGPLDDVAARFAGALLNYDAPAFLRINGDSPMIDAALIDQAIEIFQSGQFDVVTNVFPRSFPKGQSIEIVEAEIFTETCDRMQSREDKEHVTQFFYQNPQSFRIHNFQSEQNLSHINLCVDTPADFERLELMATMPNFENWTWFDAVRAYESLTVRAEIL